MMRPGRTIWAIRRRLRGGSGGTRAAYANKTTVASCGARSGGRAGRRPSGRPERDPARRKSMNVLGTGLYDAEYHEAALFVGEAELSMERHLGASEADLLATKGNIANSYEAIGRFEESLLLRRDVYSELVALMGEDQRDDPHSSQQVRFDAERPTAAKRSSRCCAKRWPSRDAFLERVMILAQDEVGLRGCALRGPRRHARRSPRASTLEETARTARRVLGGAHRSPN